VAPANADRDTFGRAGFATGPPLSSYDRLRRSYFAEKAREREARAT